MTPERWEQVEDVLQATLDRPPQERAAFLDKVCAGDEELRDEAASLVSAYDEAGDFIEQPAIERDARVIIGSQADDNIGRVVGPYRIVGHLGSGGMGEVYLAEDGRLHRLVALKILPAYFVSDEMRLRRFQREARAASALNHPNILTIYEVGEADGIHFIATEFIDGQTIRELIAEIALSLADMLDICEQVAFALSAAHAAGIVHRDIKPENIMRRTDGIVKLLDFGIAKPIEQPSPGLSNEAATLIKAQTEAGIILGTVNYMSPEQARGLPVDERTDIWSLGVVLYEMLAGRVPFKGATRMDTLAHILERAPLPPDKLAQGSAPELERLYSIVLNRALRKETSERYQSVTEMLSDLKALRGELSDATDFKLQRLSGNISAAAPASTASIFPEQATRQMPRRFPLMLIAAMLLVAVLGGTFLYRRVVLRRNAGAQNAPPANEINKKLYARMSETEQLAFINEQEQRISAMMGDRPAKLNEEALRAIKAIVDRYAARNGSMSDVAGKESLHVTYARALPYIPLITRSFAARKVPVIIGIYLPMIESEYKSCFENRTGAKGLFQFLPQTAKNYGVAPEEMCDVEKMTPAAAHYIADRMAELGDDAESMTLVLLSYNRGAEGVRNALRQLRDKPNYERNFWTLFAHREELDEPFQNESVYYVPAFFAAAIIGENPQAFELQTPPLSTLTGTN